MKLSSIKALFLLVFFFLVAISFQNCGDLKKNSAYLSHSSLGKLSCDKILLEGYKESFHTFTRENRCNDCHFVGGPGKTPFADADVELAMDAFLGMGDSSAEKLGTRAVSDHQSGYTGPHLKSSLEDQTETWDSAVETFNSCSNNRIENEKTRYVTTSKKIGLIDGAGNPIVDNEFIFLKWDLDQEKFASQATGATFEIGVKYTTEFKDTPVYVFTFPTLKTKNQTITILGITVLINGQKFGRTTFDFASVTLLPNSSKELSNIGLDLQPLEDEFLNEDDIVQIEFDYFEVK